MLIGDNISGDFSMQEAAIPNATEAAGEGNFFNMSQTELSEGIVQVIYGHIQFSVRKSRDNRVYCYSGTVCSTVHVLVHRIFPLK